MKRPALVLAILLLGAPAQAATLLWRNSCPPTATTDPAYVAGVHAIADAINRGLPVHVSMQYSELGGISWYYAQLSAMRIAEGQTSAGQYSYYASALLAMRPPINTQAQAVFGTAGIEGSVDTFGNYVYGTLGSPVQQYACYVTSWWSS
jgi:hypothetical protein